MIKLIHGADLHLDSPFSGLTPEQAAARRQEQRELLDRLAGLARERYVALEYGIESTFDATLRAVNRGHDFACARRAVEMTAAR